MSRERAMPTTSSWDTRLGSMRLLFGANSLDRLGELAGELGCRRALLVTDPGVRRAGHLERAEEALRGAGIATLVFDEVPENPTESDVERAARFAAPHAVDCVIALGGGSAMDCAKGANLVLTNGGRMRDFRGLDRASRPALPSLGIPTTAGTGSEAQSYALILHDETRTKMACGDRSARFRTVVLDPTLLRSVSRDVAATTGIDAVSHAVETYVTRRRNPLSSLYAREAWRLLESGFEALLSGAQDVDACGRMLLGAHLAGTAIELSMLGAAHACANPLTSRYGVTHGIAVGLMLPHVMEYNAPTVGRLYEELGRESTAAGSGRPLVERVLELRRAAGLPEKIRDYPIPRDCFPDLAREAADQWTAGFNPRRVTPEALQKLYEAAY